MDSKALLRWYRANKRDLPWRSVKDPYRILVSEIMLQQTQVATVVPYYERFIARFPDAASLASASEDEVLSHWAGLGYYRRARALHACAKQICAGLPQTASDWRQMPGVGDYTASAVASIAQGERVACVDGNVRRVFARQFGLKDTSHVAALSLTAMGRSNPGDWNQAVMELGALVCTPKQPNCSSCPIMGSCIAYVHGMVDAFPVVAEQPKVKRQLHVCVCPMHRGKVGLRRIENGWWQGLWEFPRTAAKSARRGLKELGFENASFLGSLRHTVTNNRIELHAYWAKARAENLHWVTPSRLFEMAMPAPQRRVRDMLFKEVFAN